MGIFAFATIAVGLSPIRTFDVLSPKVAFAPPAFGVGEE
jgi:hypothetical protein